MRGDNVISTVGSLHEISPSTLAAAAEQFAPRIAAHSAPRFVVLLGGPNKAFPDFPRRAADLLEWGLRQCAQSDGGSLLISTSRRTPSAVVDDARRVAESADGECYEGGGDNPYVAYLAAAKAIGVTPDSINMVSEALGVGVPVVTDATHSRSDKFRRFYQLLDQRRMINDVSAPVLERAPPTAAGGRRRGRKGRAVLATLD